MLSANKINLNKAHYPVTVLGSGRRIGIWFQGCKIACKGCVSQDTWDSTIQRTIPIAQLLAWCRQVVAKDDHQSFGGITISGGEPFDQPAALTSLLASLHAWRKEQNSDFDILCYSGYPLTTLQKKYPAIVSQLDVLIPEPYLENKPTNKPWRGSDNQTMELLTERAQRIYANSHSLIVDPNSKHIQVMLDGKKVWYIGIPQRGDMTALESDCQQQGIQFDHPSWRS